VRTSVPFAPIVDAIVMGEAESIVEFAIDTIYRAPNRAAALEALAAHPNIFVPAHHGSTLAKIGACSDALLPAYSAIRTPHTELSNMFLIESERGCSRGCTYCVMRRSTNGGMRLVQPAKVKSLIPEDARRVGLVGAAPLMGPVDFQLNISTQGRLTDVKEFENIVVRALPDGPSVIDAPLG